MQKRILTAVGLAVLIASSQARSELITFDDINAGYYGLALGTYKGLTWVNTVVLAPFNTQSLGPNGAQNGIVSLSNVATNGSLGPSQISSASPFTLNSAYFGSLFNDGLNITVRGLLNGIIVDTTSFVANTSGSTLKIFNWTNIDTVTISATGGTAAFGGGGTTYMMDNLIVNAAPVPEPSSAAMILGGMAVLTAVARRRRFDC